MSKNYVEIMPISIFKPFDRVGLFNLFGKKEVIYFLILEIPNFKYPKQRNFKVSTKSSQYIQNTKENSFQWPFQLRFAFSYRDTIAGLFCFLPCLKSLYVCRENFLTSNISTLYCRSNISAIKAKEPKKPLHFLKIPQTSHISKSNMKQLREFLSIPRVQV